VIQQVTREEILPLRHRALRPTLPFAAATYPEDSHPEIFHLAEIDDGTIIACVTFFPQPLDGEPAWRFRGMATEEEHRNKGIGGQLLEAGVAEVTRRGGRLVWCNGRNLAAAFYLRHGFAIRGEEFEVPPVGLHLLFVREISPPP
jgi:predicted N-acetyltransferase YhbS